MEKKTKCCSASKGKTHEAAKAEPQDLYSGVTINTGDDNRIDAELIKERTRTLNNNPRNDALEDN